MQRGWDAACLVIYVFIITIIVSPFDWSFDFSAIISQKCLSLEKKRRQEVRLGGKQEEKEEKDKMVGGGWRGRRVMVYSVRRACVGVPIRLEGFMNHHVACRYGDDAVMTSTCPAAV